MTAAEQVAAQPEAVAAEQDQPLPFQKKPANFFAVIQDGASKVVYVLKADTKRTLKQDLAGLRPDDRIICLVRGKEIEPKITTAVKVEF